MTQQNKRTGLEVAVIGMAGRFPGAPEIDTFWENLRDGIDSISFLSQEELRHQGIPQELSKLPNFVPSRGGFLENREYFDAEFFGYTPLEARVMDPQLRMLHECCWEALEHAGYCPDNFEGSIGLYAGSASNFDWQAMVLTSGKSGAVEQFVLDQLLDKNFICTRVAYKLNLRGPAVAVQSACSTSLLAIHTAARALVTGECDMALAGGVAVQAIQPAGYVYHEGMVMSPDGRCRSFDANANGTIGGNGAGIVALKRLKFAEADGDHIMAIIKGSGANNDGNRKVGFTAPSIDAQEELIQSVLHLSRIPAESISYVEAHGSGTPLGDPIEIEALTGAFGTSQTRYCAVGSVKTNIGHLDTAAGVAGFIKAVLTLYNRHIPPGLNFESPNPRIDFSRTPFYVNTRLQKWNNDSYPLRAAVNSLGIGGTNVFVVLEENNPADDEDRIEDAELLSFSAPTSTGLLQIKNNIVEYLKHRPATNLRHAAFTLNTGRRSFRYRAVCTAKSVADAIDKLSNPQSRHFKVFDTKGKNLEIVFLFQGLGAQYSGMGRELYLTIDVFKYEMDRCFSILKSLSPIDFKTKLYPEGDEKAGQEDLHQPEIAQPLCFVYTYSLAKTLEHFGIQADAVMGYSFGEYVAACLAGVFSLEQTLELVVRRGQMISTLPRGGMMSLPIPKEEVLPFLKEGSHLAIDNGESCVVSGTVEALDEIESRMKENKLFTVRLPSTHPLHSPLMMPVKNEFMQLVESLNPQPARIPLMSNVTGNWTGNGETSNPEYWFNHLSQPVLFDGGVRQLEKKNNTLIIEIGPGSDLTSLLQRRIGGHSGIAVLNIAPPKEHSISTLEYVTNRLGSIWRYGVPVDWKRFYSGGRRKRIPLPTYPFEKKRYWIEGNPLKQLAVREKSGVLQKRPDISQWFYIPSWKRTILSFHEPALRDANEHWLVFADKSKFSGMVTELVKSNGIRFTEAFAGVAFEALDDGSFVIDPRNNGDYFTLMSELEKRGTPPAHILHLWGVAGNEDVGNEDDLFETDQYTGIYSMLFLTQAIQRCSFKQKLFIHIVTGGAFDVTGTETLRPLRAMVGGALKVVAQELPYVSVRQIDIDIPEGDDDTDPESVAHVTNELTCKNNDPLVVFRGTHRLIPAFEPVVLPEPADIPKLKRGGVYLITGGMGKIGFTIARFLAREYQAKLVLIHKTANSGRGKIEQLNALGATVMAEAVDVSDREAMERIVKQVEETLGSINGIVHAAGLVGGASFALSSDITIHQCRQQFAAKVTGVNNLAAIFSGRKLDFCLLTSSLSPVLGGLGFFAYAAANAYMDLFAARCNRESAFPWISVNWADWKFEEPAQTAGDQIGASVARLMITPDEGLATLRRILRHIQRNQVVVSSGDLEARIAQWVKLQSLEKGNECDDSIQNPGEENTEFHQRPDLLSDYAEPRNPVEEALVKYWQEMFGIEPIGIDDDFFELGGDSLKAISVVSMVYKSFMVKVPLMDMLKKTTVRQIARMISETQHAEEVLVLLNKEYPRRLFCFPPSGAYAISYKSFSSFFEDIAVYSFTFIEAEDCLDRYVDAILAVDPRGPYTLFAYSAGGCLLMEVAARLETRGYRVSDIVLADSHWWRDNSDTSEAENKENGDGQLYNEAFLEEVEKQIRMMGIEFLKDDIVRKIDAYHSYLAGIENLVPVDANIHLIKSENRDDMTEDTGFRQFANKSYVEHHGFGPHDQMFKGNYLEMNVALVKKIVTGSSAYEGVD